MFVAIQMMFVWKVYNASNNELVRTNTLVKGAIIQVDATPFRLWYEAHVRILLRKVFLARITHISPQYAQPVTKKGAKAAALEEKKDGEDKKLSNHVQRTLAERRKGAYRFFLLV
jgi:small subunit ribosomal protein S8e